MIVGGARDGYYMNPVSIQRGAVGGLLSNGVSRTDVIRIT
jgi:hypothetical protein